MSDKHGLSQLPAWLEGIWVCQTNTVYHNYRPGLRAFGGVRQTRFITSTHGPIYPGVYRSMQIPAWIGGNWVCQTNTVITSTGLAWGYLGVSDKHSFITTTGLAWGYLGVSDKHSFITTTGLAWGYLGVSDKQFITTTGPAWGCLGVSDKQGLLQQVGGL